MRKIYTLLFFIATLNIMNGQDYMPKIIPPSPQSQIFDKYVDYPVNEYSGLAEIGIPIYEIILKGTTIPLALSYHAGGIKYNHSVSYIGQKGVSIYDLKIDGDVGAGWSLNSLGIRVSRQINGKPDDKFRMYNKTTLENKKSQSIANGDKYLGGIHHYKHQSPLFLGLQSTDYLDSEYDLFTYILMNNSGHFILDQNKKPQIIEQNPHAINVNDSFSEIVIKDDNGNNYIFGGAKKGKNLVETVEVNKLSQERANSAWVLSKLTTPYGESVDYEYITYNATWAYPNYATGLKVNEAYTCGSHPSCTPSNVASLSPMSFLSSSLYEELLVSKITTNNEIITIVRGENINLSKTTITCINITDIQGNLIKKITFDYFTPTSSNWHCLLKEVKIMDASSIEKKYSFTYYNSPNTNALGATSDQWGYYTNFSSLATNVDSKAFVHNDFNNYSVIGNVTASSSNSTYKASNMTILNILSSSFTNKSINRTRNDNPHSFSLKTIAYPTGGITEYTYEPHKYRYKISDKVLIGGGQRIKKITTKADLNSPPIIIEYKYGKNEDGIGISNLDLTPRHFVDKNINIGTYQPSCKGATPGYLYNATKIFATNPNYSEFSDFRVYYEQVTKYMYEEVKNNMSSNPTLKTNGKIISTYKIPIEYIEGIMSGNKPTYSGSTGGNNGWSTFLSQYYNDLNITRINEYKIGYKPVLLNKVLFDRSNKKIQEEIYSYQETSNNLIFEGLKVDQKISFSAGFRQGADYDYTYNVYRYVDNLYNEINYKIYTGTYLLSSKESILYFDQNSFKTKESYLYDGLKRVITQTNINNVSDIIQNEFIYPPQGTHLYNKNMLSTVLETINKYNGFEINRIKTNYDNSFLPTSVQTSNSGINDLRTMVTFDKYDSKGNLLQFTTINGMVTTYLWSYNKSYPIAEIKNATLSQVESQLGTTAEAISNLSTPNFTIIESLKQKLPNAYISIYKYKPLVGMISTTDPAGVNTFFEYSNFNKLKIIKDHYSSKVIDYKYSYNNGQVINETEPPLNPNLLPDMEVDIPSIETKYAINTTIPSLYAYVEGGSGNFRYSWYLKDISGKIIQQLVESTNPHFYMNKITQSGTMVLLCSVRDITSSKTKTISKSFDVTYGPLQEPNFDINPPYFAENEYTFLASVPQGGSGQFIYEWYIYDQSFSTILYSIKNKTEPSFKYYFQEGIYQILFVAKDQVTNEQTNISKRVTITNKIKVGFVNTYQSRNTMEGTIQVGRSATVTLEFEAWSRNAPTFEGTSITFKIGNQSVFMNSAQKKYITVNLSPNSSFNDRIVKIVYTKGNGSKCVNAHVKIIDGDSTNCIENNSLGMCY